MFSLPFMPNLIISTVVFIIAAWYLNRFFDGQGFPKGVSRRFVVFFLAYLLSWGSSEIVDWAVGKPVKAKSTTELSQLFNMFGG